MATTKVTLTVTDAGVAVSDVTAAGQALGVRNPQFAKQGDTVTWVFIGGSADLHMVFKEVRFPNASGGLGSSEFVEEQGPFSGPLSRSRNEISGTIAEYARNGRYLYEIRDGNGRPLHWTTPLMPKRENFGGLDVPRTPPK